MIPRLTCELVIRQLVDCFDFCRILKAFDNLCLRVSVRFNRYKTRPVHVQHLVSLRNEINVNFDEQWRDEMLAQLSLTSVSIQYTVLMNE